MKLSFLKLGILSFFVFCIPVLASAHCEIPCGIYDDPMRIDLLKEHIRTMEKSMLVIGDLKEEKDKNYNQLVRWIMNKEDHANKFQEIVSQYFMTQRINPGEKMYDKKLGVLHEMLYNAMKCKQSTDMKYIEKLRKLVDEFAKLYFGENYKKEHGHEH